MSEEVHTFKLNDIDYRADKLSVFKQLTVTSKLTPILTLLAQQKDKEITKEKFPQFFAAFSSYIKEEDVNEIIRICLPSVKRRFSNKWMPVYHNGELAFSDLDLKAMLHIIYQVLEANKLLDFFTGALLISEEETNQ
jgi:hypothetical protein